MPVAVALDTRGAEAARQWIEAASPTYPCLIDERHVVAELYGMVNVPNAVWIDEHGRIVRPSEPAGATDAFRTGLDRETMQMSEEGLAAAKRTKDAYYDAVGAWVREGRYALDATEARRRAPRPTEDDALAAAHFRLAQHLVSRGLQEDARRHAAEAARLRPRGWNYRRQAWNLEDDASLDRFFAAVDDLGDEPYHEPIRL